MSLSWWQGGGQRTHLLANKWKGNDSLVDWERHGHNGIQHAEDFICMWFTFFYCLEWQKISKIWHNRILQTTCLEYAYFETSSRWIHEWIMYSIYYKVKRSFISMILTKFKYMYIVRDIPNFILIVHKRAEIQSREVNREIWRKNEYNVIVTLTCDPRWQFQ